MKLDSETCWNAVRERDTTKDGTFVYGVLTTGVYCRPSCASRRALRKNVRFFATPADAERAGLRACLRCKPSSDRTHDAIDTRVAKACELITRNVEQPLALKQLAAAVGLTWPTGLAAVRTTSSAASRRSSASRRRNFMTPSACAY